MYFNDNCRFRFSMVCAKGYLPRLIVIIIAIGKSMQVHQSHLCKDGYRNACRVIGDKRCQNISYLLCKCLIKISGWGWRRWEARYREVTWSIWQKNGWNSSSKYLANYFIIMVFVIWHPLEHWFCKTKICHNIQKFKSLLLKFAKCQWSMLCLNFKAENTYLPHAETTLGRLDNWKSNLNMNFIIYT